MRLLMLIFLATSCNILKTVIDEEPKLGDPISGQGLFLVYRDQAPRTVLTIQGTQQLRTVTIRGADLSKVTCFKQSGTTAQLQEFDCSNGSFTYTLDDFNNFVNFEIRDQDGRVEFFSPANQLRGPTSSPVRFVNCDVVETTTRSASDVNTLLANHNTVCFGSGGRIENGTSFTITQGKSLIALENQEVLIDNLEVTLESDSKLVGFEVLESGLVSNAIINALNASNIVIDDIVVEATSSGFNNKLIRLSQSTNASIENSRIISNITNTAIDSIYITNNSVVSIKESFVQCVTRCIHLDGSSVVDISDRTEIFGDGDLNDDTAILINSSGNAQVNIFDSEVRVGAAKGLQFIGSGSTILNFNSSRLIKVSNSISIALDVPTSGPSSLNLNFSPDSQICTIDPNDSFSEILFNPSSVTITENLEDMLSYTSNTGTPVCVN